MADLNTYSFDIAKKLKLSERHLFGNEQQGRFVTRRLENEPLYYLANISDDTIATNNCRVWFDDSPLMPGNYEKES